MENILRKICGHSLWKKRSPFFLIYIHFSPKFHSVYWQISSCAFMKIGLFYLERSPTCYSSISVSPYPFLLSLSSELQHPKWNNFKGFCRDFENGFWHQNVLKRCYSNCSQTGRLNVSGGPRMSLEISLFRW